MKKTVIAPLLAVIGCAALVATLALGGAGKFGDVQVNADPVEYSVTFNADNTLIGMVEDSYIIFLTTTERGNMVGVSGRDNGGGNITFADRYVEEIHFYNDGYLPATLDFDHFTGVEVVFEGSDDFAFTSNNGDAVYLESGVRVSRECAPNNYPRITAWDEVDITSITIYYTC